MLRSKGFYVTIITIGLLSGLRFKKETKTTKRDDVIYSVDDYILYYKYLQFHENGQKMQHSISFKSLKPLENNTIDAKSE